MKQPETTNFNLKELGKEIKNGIIILAIIIITWQLIITNKNIYTFALLISIVTASQLVISSAVKKTVITPTSFTRTTLSSFFIAGLFYFIISFGLTLGILGLIGLIIIFTSYRIYKSWSTFKSASIHIGKQLGRKPK